MRLSIKKLYGRFDYDMVFPNSGVTILTGPNGFGKSTLLRCISAVGKSNLAFFTRLKLDAFSLSSDRDEGHFDLICNDPMNYEINNEVYTRIDLRHYSGASVNSSSDSAQFLNYAVKYQRRLMEKSEEKTAEEMESLSKLLQMMPRITGEVSLIQEQRLLTEISDRRTTSINEPVSSIAEAVSNIPRTFLELLNQTTREYSAVATRLDSQFLHRLVNSEKSGNFSESDFVREYADTRRKLDTLRENGISNFPELGDLHYQSKNADAFRIFFEDFGKKYSVYAPLMEKMTLYRNIINKRLQFKTLSYSEKGIEIYNDSGSLLPLERLSSGEKEILLLYFRLIFQTQKDMLILIDEPEISLHIAWQRSFVPDLKRIAKINGFSAIIATHSPFISDSVASAKYDLGEMYKNART